MTTSTGVNMASGEDDRHARGSLVLPADSSQAVLDPAEAERLAARLKVIADPTRLRLLSLIQAQPGGEACVCNLTEPLGLSQPTVSHHLRVLRRRA